MGDSECRASVLHGVFSMVISAHITSEGWPGWVELRTRNFPVWNECIITKSSHCLNYVSIHKTIHIILPSHLNHWPSATSLMQCCYVRCSKSPDNTGWSLLHCCQSTSVEQSTTSSAWLWTVTSRVSQVTESTDLTDSRPDRFSFAHRFCFSFSSQLSAVD